MLFKNLKAIMNEADEAAAPPADAAPADGTAITPPPTVDKPKAPKKFKDVSDDNANGVSPADVQGIVDRLITPLKISIQRVHRVVVKSVKPVENLIIIGFKDDITEKAPAIIGTIQQQTVALLNTDIDKFNLTEPTLADPQTITIAVTSAITPEVPVK